jgi:hypothetical protein
MILAMTNHPCLGATTSQPYRIQRVSILTRFLAMTNIGGFPGLGLKTSSYGLVIWASKTPRRFFGLGLKTKWVMVCRLHHKTDESRMAQDTSRSSDLLHLEASRARVSQFALKLAEA